MSKLPDCSAVFFQIGMLQKELADVSPLLELVLKREPDAVEIRAVGSVLQTFYNGVEAILDILTRDEGTNRQDWHKHLLEQSLVLGIVSEGLYSQLDQFRKFRHKFKHSYGFTLQWPMMAPLCGMLLKVFNEFKATLEPICPHPSEISE